MRNTTATIGLLVLSAALLAMTVSSADAKVLSPLKQFKQGVPIEQIQCNGSAVLLESPKGKPACVKDSTAKKLLDRGYLIVQKTIPEDTLIDDVELTTSKTNENHTSEIIDEYNETTLQSLTNIYIVDKTGKELEKIPNPSGYWVPIVDKNEFAERFFNAVDDEIIEIKDRTDHKGDYIGTEYDGRDGFLVISDYYIITDARDQSAWYFSTDTAFDRQKQMEYVNNFMNKIGFKVNGNDVLLSESFIDNCTEVFSVGYSCRTPGGPVSIGIRLDDKYHTAYIFGSKYDGIAFLFYNKAYKTYSDYGVKIRFNGWSNHPELIKTTMNLKNTIDLETAKQKAYDFALKNDELNKSHRDEGLCEYKPFEKDLKAFNGSLDIVSGVPYYIIKTGLCTYDNTNTGHFYRPLVMVDAWTGDSIFLIYLGGGD